MRWPCGWYWSDSQLLVSNISDDMLWKDTPLANWPANANKIPSLGEDDEPPSATEFNNKGGYSFPLSDRTHKVALGGKVVASYGTATDAEVDVKIRKSVKLTVYILKQPGYRNGDQVVTTIKVEDQIRRARELFAQVGIDIPAVTITDRNVPGATPGPNGYPAVDLSDGLEPATTIPADKRVLPPEMKNLLENTIGRTATANNVDDIEVYYVNYATGRPELSGQANPRSMINDVKYYDTVVMYGDNADDDVLAHEMWHVIENLQGWHTPYSDWTVRYPFRINLMIGDSENLNNPVQVHNSVRLDQKQEERADNGTEPGDPKLLY